MSNDENLAIRGSFVSDKLLSTDVREMTAPQTNYVLLVKI